MIFEGNTVCISTGVVSDLVLCVKITACDVRVVVELVCQLVQFCRSDFVFWRYIGNRKDESRECFDFYCYSFDRDGCGLHIIFRRDSIVHESPS